MATGSLVVVGVFHPASLVAFDAQRGFEWKNREPSGVPLPAPCSGCLGCLRLSRFQGATPQWAVGCVGIHHLPLKCFHWYRVGLFFPIAG